MAPVFSRYGGAPVLPGIRADKLLALQVPTAPVAPLPDFLLQRGSTGPGGVVAIGPPVVDIAATVPVPTFDLQANGVVAGVAGVVAVPALALAAAHGVSVGVAATVPVPVVAIAAAHGVAVGLAATVPVPVVAIGAAHGVGVTLAATVPVPTVAIGGNQVVAGVAGTVPVPAITLTATFTGASLSYVYEALAATVPVPTVAISAAHGLSTQLPATVPVPTSALRVAVVVLEQLAGVVSVPTSVHFMAVGPKPVPPADIRYGRPVSGKRRRRDYLE